MSSSSPPFASGSPSAVGERSYVESACGRTCTAARGSFVYRHRQRRRLTGLVAEPVEHVMDRAEIGLVVHKHLGDGALEHLGADAIEHLQQPRRRRPEVAAALREYAPSSGATTGTTPKSRSKPRLWWARRFCSMSAERCPVDSIRWSRS